MSHKKTISTRDLQIGMFVSDLDRPWIETPFLMEGLLVASDSEIATLQQLCRTVVVDGSRSVGHAYVPRNHERDAPLKAAEPHCVFREVDEARPEDLMAICRSLDQEPVLRRYRQAPSINPQTGQSRLEPELLYSAPIIDDVKKSLKSIHESLQDPRKESFSEIAPAVSELARSVERNADAMIWLTRLRSVDEYAYDHALDVSIHLMIFARFLGLPAGVIEDLGTAGMLQDIGKIEVPQEILHKPGDLTAEEYYQVQAHVAASLEMLMGNPAFTTGVLDIVASHHERADGSGYPRRLKGERISLHGELSGLVDTYCAMTRNRPYGPAISTQKALEALVAKRGQKFREVIVDQFIQCIGLYPVGSLVELNSGEVGVVVQQHQTRRLKPRLFIILGPDKSIERHPITIDLMMEPSTPTGEPYRIVRALPNDAYGINPGEFYLA